MTTADSNAGPTRTGPGRPAFAVTRLGWLTGGALGLLGFSLAVLRGLAADNTLPAVLERAVTASIVLALVGGLAGSVAGRLIEEYVLKHSGDEGETVPGSADQAESAGPAGESGPGTAPSENTEN